METGMVVVEDMVVSKVLVDGASLFIGKSEAVRRGVLEAVKFDW